MSKPNRNRKHSICVRMNDEEYQELQSKLQESGQTMQSYVNNAIHGGKIATPEEVQILQELNKKFGDASTQFRGVATNLNQMAHSINLLISLLQDEELNQTKINDIIQSLPKQQDLMNVAYSASEYRKDIGAIWQSLRQSVARQKVTPDSGTQSNTSSETTKLKKATWM